MRPPTLSLERGTMAAITALTWAFACTVHTPPPQYQQPQYAAQQPAPHQQEAPAPAPAPQPAAEPAPYPEPAPVAQPAPPVAQPAPPPVAQPAPYPEPAPPPVAEPAPYPEPAPPPVAVPAPPPGPDSQLTPRGPIRCNGRQRVRLDRVRITSRANGVTVQGRCTVLITDSEIVASRHGIRVSGQGTVTVRRSMVRGAHGSIRLTNRATLSADHTRFAGAVLRSNDAAFRDQGGNSFTNGGIVPPRAEPDVPPPPVESRPAPGLEPSGPYRCGGSQTLRLSRLHITSRDNGVTVKGRCTVVITDSEIVASRYAIQISGRGQVTIRRSKVRGALGSVRMTNAATLTSRNTAFAGGLLRRDQAVFRDRGGNTFSNGGIVPPRDAPDVEPVPAPRPAPPAGGPVIPRRQDLKPSGPIECRGNETLRLDNLRIESRTHGLTVRGSCAVVISDSHIVASGWAIRASGRATVTVQRSKVSGRKGAIKLGNRSTLTARRSRFIGGQQRSGQAVLRDAGGNEWRN